MKKKILLPIMLISLTVYASGRMIDRLNGTTTVTVESDQTITIEGTTPETLNDAIQDVIDTPVLSGDDVSSVVFNAKIKALDMKINNNIGGSGGSSTFTSCSDLATLETAFGDPITSSELEQSACATANVTKGCVVTVNNTCSTSCDLPENVAINGVCVSAGVDLNNYVVDIGWTMNGGPYPSLEGYQNPYQGEIGGDGNSGIEWHSVTTPQLCGYYNDSLGQYGNGGPIYHAGDTTPLTLQECQELAEHFGGELIWY